jgi:hypothetical protein
MVTGAAGLILMSWASRAEATEFELAWSAPAGCPSRLEIIEATRARLREAPSEEPPQVFIHGTVTPERSGFVISLVLKDNAGHAVGERQVNVEGPSCKAVKGPTALLLAIMIAERPRVAPDTAPQEPPSPPPPPEPPAGPAPQRSETTLPAPGRAAPPPSTMPPRVSLGVAGMTSLGLLPNVGLGVALRATYAPSPLLLFALESSFEAGGVVRAGTGEVGFHLVGGSAAAGIRALRVGPAELMLTLAVRAGAILVQPSGFAVAHSQVGTAALAGPGVLVRAKLGPRLFVEAWPEIDAVFVRDRFQIHDGETFEIHRPSHFAGRLSLGLGYELR